VVHNWETLISAPMMKAGMHAYREEVKGNVETASGGEVNVNSVR
jgi:hypothetical protein